MMTLTRVRPRSGDVQVTPTTAPVEDREGENALSGRIDGKDLRGFRLAMLASVALWAMIIFGVRTVYLYAMS